MKKESINHSQYSDAILTISSYLNINDIEIHFKDCIPVQLNGIDFNIEATPEDIITCYAIFKYSYYDIILI